MSILVMELCSLYIRIMQCLQALVLFHLSCLSYVPNFCFLYRVVVLLLLVAVV